MASVTEQAIHSLRSITLRPAYNLTMWLAVTVCFLSDRMLVVTAMAQINDDAPAALVKSDQTQNVPIVIAHRGASGYLPEHTTEGVVLAHAMLVDYIEQDVVLSKDGIPIVFHDLILDDVTNAASVFPDRKRADEHWYAMDFTLEELRALTLTERRTPSRPWKDRGNRFPLESGRFRISTLAEHLQLIQGLNKTRPNQAGVYVEFKGPAEHRAAGLDISKAIRMDGPPGPLSQILVNLINNSLLHGFEGIKSGIIRVHVVAVSDDGKNWNAALVLENDPDAPSGFAYPAVIQTHNGLIHITYTWERQRIKHVVIDPTHLSLRPIVNGEWPK